MKALALFVADGMLMVAIALALVIVEPDVAWAAQYVAGAGAAIAGSAILASIVLQVRRDHRAADVD